MNQLILMLTLDVVDGRHGYVLKTVCEANGRVSPGKPTGKPDLIGAADQLRPLTEAKASFKGCKTNSILMNY